MMNIGTALRLKIAWVWPDTDSKAYQFKCAEIYLIVIQTRPPQEVILDCSVFFNRAMLIFDS